MAVGGERGRVRLLLGSSSLAALLIGCGAPSAWAACNTSYTGTTAPGCTNSTTITGIAISGSTITSSINNTGIVSPNGISVTSSSISGAISDTGILNGGIQIDGTSTITNSHTAIFISGTSFTGGISNGGTISVSASSGILAHNITSFSGGITNSGAITFVGGGIAVRDVTTFVNGINNSGTLAFGSTGIAVTQTSTFSGGVSNSGTITAGYYGINLFQVTNFSGGISNAAGATISAGIYGVWLNANSSFGGPITNAGLISAPTAINIQGSTIHGSIVDSGVILGTTHGISIDSTSLLEATGPNNAITVDGPTFTGGISNAGTITAVGVGNAISLHGVTSFSGGIDNSGYIRGENGIFIGAGVTFTGDAIVNTGTIAAGNANAINAATATSPVVIDQMAGIISGSILLSAHADVLNIGGGTINGSIIGRGSSDTINFALGAGNTFTYAAPYEFTGINAVNVISGTAIINGTGNSATTLTVSNGGTLAGTGSITTAMTVQSGGSFAPGSGTPGSAMTVAGSLAFQAGAIYLVQVNPATASYADITGSASLAGTVRAAFASGSYVQKQYTILESGGLGGSTFGGLTTTNLPPGFTASLSYNPDDVFLDLTATLGGATGLNVNQQNVANALNTYFNNGGSLPPGFLTIFGLNGAALANALSHLDGEDATDAEKGAFELMTSFLNLMLDPFSGGGGGNGSGGAPGFTDEDHGLPPDLAEAYAAVLKAPPPQNFDQRWRTWGSAFGGTNRTNGDPAAGSTDVSVGDYGFAAGMDYRVTPQTLLGFALAGGGTNWSLAQNLGSGRSDAFQAGLYAKSFAGPAYISGAVAFANHWFDTSRTAALGDQLQARFTGQDYGARLEAGYRYAVMPLAGVTPYAALQVQDFHTPGYSETDLSGGGFALSYAAQSSADTRTELGARFDSLTTFDAMPLILRGRLAWAHDWVSDAALDATFQSLPGASFIVNGAPIPANSALTTAAAELHMTANWSMIAKFDGEFAAGAQTYAGTGTLRYTW